MNTQPLIFPRQIFRAYDIRGKVSQLDTRTIYAIAHGLVAQYQSRGQKSIVLGYDARLTGPTFAWIIESVFKKQGMNVENIGCCSTPQMYFAARHKNGNGIMVTASHNPKHDNGIKWIIEYEPPCPDMIQNVGEYAEGFYFQHDQLPTPPQLTHQIKSEYCLAYQHALLKDIQLKRPLKVVLDGMHGAAGRCADLVLQKMGCEVISIRCHENGEFPDHPPDPSQAKHLTQLKEKILLHQADLGIALDGDGDRAVILDENAHIVSADRLLALFASLCLSQHPHHEIVYDVKCSTMVSKTIEQLQGIAKMIRTGSSFMRRYISQSKGRAVFGGEYAGHYVFNDGRGFGYDDGIYAALRVMEALSQLNITLSEYLAQFPDRFGTEDTYIETQDANPQDVLALIEQNCKSTGAKMSKIDGIRLDFDYGFGIMRASNTGEYFTVRFDADSPSKLYEIRQHFVKILNEKYPVLAQSILNAH